MASLPSASNSTAASKWAPFSGPGNFASNMIILLILLFCSLVLIIALNAIIRHLLCSLRRRHTGGSLPSDIEHATSNGKILSASSSSSSSSPSLTFSATTKLAGAAAECSICLTEFADGDQVRVLPACNHGFHVDCVGKWLVSSKSCPTCRANCHVAGV